MDVGDGVVGLSPDCLFFLNCCDGCTGTLPGKKTCCCFLESCGCDALLGVVLEDEESLRDTLRCCSMKRLWISSICE